MEHEAHLPDRLLDPAGRPAYYAARYPVIVVQFHVFVEVSGYKSSDKHSFEGLENQSVVWVTGYDALAYCKWLTETLREWEGTPDPLATLLRKDRWVITLPSEAECGKAARGTDEGVAGKARYVP